MRQLEFRSVEVSLASSGADTPSRDGLDGLEILFLSDRFSAGNRYNRSAAFVDRLQTVFGP